MTMIQELISGVNGASFIGIDTETTPTLKGGKKNPMQGRVRKVMIGASVMVFQNKNGSSYENMINRRLVAEGKDPNFEVGPRKWGTRVEGTPFVTHNGVTYIEVIFLKAGKVHYTVDGKEVDGATIEGLDVDKEETSEQGGLNNKVIIRTFLTSSIKRMTINGKTFNL
jgi:hypothetical protein